MNRKEEHTQASEVGANDQEHRDNIARLERELEKAQQENQRLKRENQRLKQENQKLAQRLAQYEPEPTAAAENSEPSPSASDYGFASEEKRRRKNARKKQRRKQRKAGRRPTAEKFAQAEVFQDIYPEGVPAEECRLARERAVWRVLDSRLTLVGYRIHAGPDGKEPPIPGVPPRCEFGIEVLVTLAYLKYIIGISLDKACQVLEFFWQRPLAKSQADALLRQLAKLWQSQFETLCDLLAQAAVVCMDETGWKQANQSLSAWVFLSALHQVHLFGCHKDGATLEVILPQSEFEGVGVSDHAAIYGTFRAAQKCWAHLLRKAIRLARLYPENARYQEFLDSLLALYYDAKRAASDGRLGPAGRERRVDEFDARLIELVSPFCHQDTKGLPPHEQDFCKLCRELFELGLSGELFTFVLCPEVPPTNNESERELRPTTLDRKAGRNTKTPAGSRRRSIIVSVLSSLRRNLEQFTLSAVLAEVTRWMREGRSLFQKQWAALQAQSRASPEAEGTTSARASPSRLEALFGAVC